MRGTITQNYSLGIEHPEAHGTIEEVMSHITWHQRFRQRQLDNAMLGILGTGTLPEDEPYKDPELYPLEEKDWGYILLNDWAKECFSRGEPLTEVTISRAWKRNLNESGYAHCTPMDLCVCTDFGMIRIIEEL